METNIKRRCDHCKQWNDGRPEKCVHCGQPLDKRKHRDQVRDEEKTKQKELDEAAFRAKPLPVQILIKIGRVVKIIYISIISFISWLLFWIGG